MADFVTVAAFDAAPEAYIIKGLLEQAGIPAFIRNEHLVGVQWLYSNAVGGVQVQVPAEHASAALEVLRSCSEEAASKREPEEDVRICPHCGSREVESRRSGLLAALSLYLSIPLPFARRRNHCKACGAAWR